MFIRAGTCYTLYVLMEELEQDDPAWHFWPATEDGALGFIVEGDDTDD